MKKHKKTQLILIAAALGIFSLFFIDNVKAGTICYFKGPETSPDFLRLSDLSLTGNLNLETGDTITIKFNLQNYGQSNVTLGQRGFFAAARDPDNIDVSFGFTGSNSVVKPGETIAVEASRILDKAGTWIVWPSYHILSGKEYKLGPDNWHSCSLKVGAKIIDSDQDGVADDKDNCPSAYNPNQENTDGDSSGNACDNCDDRDTDQDKIKNCLDKCPAEPETYNNYQDDDGCPDVVPTENPKESEQPKQEQKPTPEPESESGTPKAMPGEKPGTIIIILPTEGGVRTETINSPTRETVTEGPIMPGAFEDGDGDGVLNIIDECPETPAGKSVFENGCRCQDSDGGRNIWTKGTISYYKDDGTTYSSEESCLTDRYKKLREYYCTANAERLDIMSRISTEDIVCENGCEDGQCKPLTFRAATTLTYEMMIPLGACSTGEATCSDGIQNQDETGVDCGGKCPPCNSVCETPTKYAPADTPCRTHFFGGGVYVNASGRRTSGVINASDETRSDQHRIELGWVEGGGECNCQFYEVCDEGLDFVVEEALQCCGATSLDEVESMPDPNLCKAALRGANGNCKKCAGLYIVKGLGTYARWMQGYDRTRYMDYYICGAWAEAAPTERLINEHKTGICRDYSGALVTLLRKAGYGQREVGNFCDGVHCYNVVKFPGDAKWHVVDTTGNWQDVVMGGLPGGYPYCFALNQANWCFNNTKTFDVERYRESIAGGTPFVFTTCVSQPAFVGNYSGYDYNFNQTFSVQCGLGMACSRDNFELPDFAPAVNQIVGCD